MRVRQGWSGEFRPNVWGKVSVELDEIDLYRALQEAGLDILAQTARIPLTAAFQLLDADSERLLLAKLVARYGAPREEASARMAELGASRRSAIDQITQAVTGEHT